MQKCDHYIVVLISIIHAHDFHNVTGVELSVDFFLDFPKSKCGAKCIPKEDVLMPKYYNFK